MGVYRMKINKTKRTVDNMKKKKKNKFELLFKLFMEQFHIHRFRTPIIRCINCFYKSENPVSEKLTYVDKDGEIRIAVLTWYKCNKCMTITAKPLEDFILYSESEDFKKVVSKLKYKYDFYKGRK